MGETRHVFPGEDERVDSTYKENMSPIDHLPRERNEVKSLRAESREQLGAILDALELVSKLAAMDCATYCSSHFTGVTEACRFQTKGAGDKANASKGESNSQITVITNSESTRMSRENDNSKATFLCTKFFEEDISGKREKTQDKQSDSECYRYQQHYIEKENGIQDHWCSDHNVSMIQSRLDELQLQWKLEETPLLSVNNSIHRLQSNLYHAQIEADIAAPQVQALNHELVKYKKRNEKLEKAAKKLYRNNIKLKERLRETKNAKKSFVKSVKDYLKRKRVEELDKEELHVATRLTVHEKLLQMNGASTKHHNGATCKSLRDILQDEEDASLHFYSGRSRHGDEEKSNYDRNQDFPLIGNRIRTSTSDSIYSELDPLFDPVCCHDHELTGDDPSIQSSDISRLMKNSEESYDPIFDDSKSCSASTWSARSLVTDECMGTVRLDSSSSMPLAPDRSNDNEGGSIRSYSPFNILTFPLGLEVGLQFQALPLRKDARIINEDLLNVSFTNRCRSFSDGAVLDLNSGPGEEITKTIRNKSPSSFHFNKSFFSQSCSKVEEAEYTFVVSGFKGFDTTLNTKPAIGDQLIAIDDESLLDRNWSWDKLKQVMEQRASSAPTESSGSFTLTFRNDPLTKIQKIALDEALVSIENKDQIVGETSVNQPENLTAGKVALMPMKSPTRSSVEKSPVKTSFFELFKNPSSSDTVEKEKKSSLSFFKPSFTTKEGCSSPNFSEPSLFVRLNSSSKRNKESLSTLPELEDNDNINNDASISKSEGSDVKCDESALKNGKAKSSDTMFFGIFSSSKKKEKGIKNGKSKLSGVKISGSKTLSRGELILSKKETIEPQETASTDEELGKEILEIRQNGDESKTYLVQINKEIHSIPVDCNGESNIEGLKVLPEIPSSAKISQERYEESGCKGEMLSSEQELSKNIVIDTNDDPSTDDNESHNESPIPKETQSEGIIPPQTFGLQFITLF